MYQNFLNADEYQRIDNLFQTIIRERRWRKRSLEQSLKDWEYFVTSVERGYALTVVEYGNSLDGRVQLQQLTEELTVPLFDKLVKLLRSWDDRLMASTQEGVLEVASSTKVLAGQRFWYSRVPKRLRFDQNPPYSYLSEWLPFYTEFRIPSRREQ
jgi:hypothetical protein